MQGLLSKIMNRNTKYATPLYEVPRDPEDPRYLLAFRLDQTVEIKKFFEEFGFVIVRDVLTPQQCTATIDDIWNYIEQREYPLPPHNVLRKDPKTWQNSYWPSMQEEGIVGGPPVFSKAALENRQNPNIHKVYAALYGREDLLCNHDRFGLFRPTKDYVIDGVPVSMYDWKTFENVHLDMNPWSYVEEPTAEHGERVLGKLRYKHSSDFITENNEVGVLANPQLHIQGLINLADNFLEDGGFHIVPGFHRHLVEWAQKNEKMKQAFGKYQTFIVIHDDPVHERALRVTARAGSLVLWDQRTAHGSAPNDSPNIRYAQFLKMFPATPMDPARWEARCAAINKHISNMGGDFEATELGKKVLGLEKWG